jgi:hypothetical protein
LSATSVPPPADRAVPRGSTQKLSNNTKIGKNWYVTCLLISGIWCQRERHNIDRKKDRFPTTLLAFSNNYIQAGFKYFPQFDSNTWKQVTSTGKCIKSQSSGGVLYSQDQATESGRRQRSFQKERGGGGSDLYSPYIFLHFHRTRRHATQYVKAINTKQIGRVPCRICRTTFPKLFSVTSQHHRTRV